uniref:Uncharacterized protein n=1 Tax=Ascaris lumbricoides TaxID=6252 RepID=A0A0M3HGH2_ASCLU
MLGYVCTGTRGYFYVTCVHALRNLRRIFEITFKIDEWKKTRKEGDDQRVGSENKAILTCIGVGFSNLNKIVL